MTIYYLSAKRNVIISETDLVKKYRTKENLYFVVNFEVLKEDHTGANNIICID